MEIIVTPPARNGFSTTYSFHTSARLSKSDAVEQSATCGVRLRGEEGKEFGFVFFSKPHSIGLTGSRVLLPSATAESVDL
jgi:hypothetical protein